MFITPAYAQAAAPSGSDAILQFLPFIGILIIFYFLLIRPQQKRAKQHQEMVNNVRRGDTIVTNGGIIGKVTKVVDNFEVEIQIAEGTKIRQIKQMIAEVRAKGEPAANDA
ncbi:MAG: preprotein translocase subunit YajC [Xanthobacteraceae bacterium]|mgnify:FL=1|nr:preprotein translocase subunit YajC [Xanthobacteraceae bacterium]QYK46324.1 MAG: preprotein translocase subunit YajC [Xanthobacteraceae bacterium]